MRPAAAPVRMAIDPAVPLVCMHVCVIECVAVARRASVESIVIILVGRCDGRWDDDERNEERGRNRQEKAKGGGEARGGTNTIHSGGYVISCVMRVYRMVVMFFYVRFSFSPFVLLFCCVVGAAVDLLAPLSGIGSTDGNNKQTNKQEKNKISMGNKLKERHKT